MVAVSLVQCALPPRSNEAALRSGDHMDALIAQAVSQGGQVVVLPELWRSGPFELEHTLDAALELEHAEVGRWGHLAAELGIWLCAGTVLERDATSDQLFNTAVVFNPDGDLVGRYRKRHLFGFDDGEAALLTAGDEVVVVDTPLGPTGLATCYDLRFPEHFRALVDAGAHSVVLPTGWPQRRLSHWQVLMRARAIENQLWMVGCNAVGPSGEVTLAGHSMVVDPWGETAEAGEEETVMTVEVDPQLTARTREQFPVLRDRRR